MIEHDVAHIDISIRSEVIHNNILFVLSAHRSNTLLFLI